MVWLKLNVDQWPLISRYSVARDFFSSLTVVNDPAERGVKLVQDFVNSTTDEALRQDMMIAVLDHRKKVTGKNMTKKSLSNMQ